MARPLSCATIAGSNSRTSISKMSRGEGRLRSYSRKMSRAKCGQYCALAGELSFADSQQSRRRSRTGGFASLPQTMRSRTMHGSGIVRAVEPEGENHEKAPVRPNNYRPLRARFQCLLRRSSKEREASTGSMLRAAKHKKKAAPFASRSRKFVSLPVLRLN